MKKMNGKIIKEISFYIRKLPLIKQIEALDFVRWLWGGLYSEEPYTKEELDKLESLAKQKGGRKFKDWESAKKYLEGLAR